MRNVHKKRTKSMPAETLLSTQKEYRSNICSLNLEAEAATCGQKIKQV